MPQKVICNIYYWVPAMGLFECRHLTLAALDLCRWQWHIIMLGLVARLHSLALDEGHYVNICWLSLRICSTEVFAATPTHIARFVCSLKNYDKLEGNKWNTIILKHFKLKSFNQDYLIVISFCVELSGGVGMGSEWANANGQWLVLDGLHL